MLDQVAVARRSEGHLLVRGETGSGKEMISKAFHEAAPRPGPLVTFNCANIQRELAEARLFGTVKGGFSEARDTAGLFLRADGGVLFLDEIAELDLDVQGKLLRAVETGEVQRVGESQPRRVKVALVAASHQALQARVKAHRFRADLLFRLNQFAVEIPPLRERLEEIPWLMQLALGDRPASLHVSIIEAALLRPWPGNVRELISATRAAVANAAGGTVKATHLAREAGLADDEDPGSTPERRAKLTKEVVVAMLAECNGNATLAARRLGLQRTTLSRLRKEYGLTLAR